MWKLFKQSIYTWYDNDPFTRSAAIAYYTIFSFPALLIIVMGIANTLIDQEVIKTSIIGTLGEFVGKDAAVETFQTIDRVNITPNNSLIFIFGAAMLVYTSLRIFLQLQTALNEIWRVNTKEFKWKKLLLQRAYSFGLLVSIAFILIVSLLVTSALTALTEWIGLHISESLVVLLHLANIAVSFAIISFLFTLILKVLPDTHIQWRTAAVGGTMTAFLFLIGQYAMNIYFEMAKPESAYGVSGSVILLMLWVSYSTTILLFGAEFSKAYKELKAAKKK